MYGKGLVGLQVNAEKTENCDVLLPKCREKS
jgi:hypothetical protein